VEIQITNFTAQQVKGDKRKKVKLQFRIINKICTTAQVELLDKENGKNVNQLEM